MSELRKDLVSGDWIIVAPARARRPHLLVPPKKKREVSPKRTCPFEEGNLRKAGEWPPILSYPDEERWRVIVIPNRYPAVAHHQACTDLYHRGPYPWMAGIGHHDLLVSRHHTKGFADLGAEEAAAVFFTLQRRYRSMATDRCLLYTSAFLNWGPAAGASVAHPHYQVVTLPIVPPDIAHSLSGSERYFKKHGRCVHCDIIRYEKKERTRVIGENRFAIAFAPFVSREPFEVRVFPKRHVPYFEKTKPSDVRGFTEILQRILRKIRKNLKDVDFNFFVHSSPLKYQSKYRHYHWHVEIVPKVTIAAGFELSTGLEINIVDPDHAAATLRR